MAFSDPLLTFEACFARATAEAAKSARAGLQRTAAAVGTACRLRCGTRIPGPAGNSLRSLRSLRSDTPASKSVHEARCARGPGILRSSPPQMRAAGLPGPTLRQALLRATRRHATTGGRRGERCPLRVSSASARRGAGTQAVRGTACALRPAGPRGPARPARPGIGRSERSEPRELTPRGVSERRERSERSELPRGRPMTSIAAQSARRADRRTPNPQRVPLAGPATAFACKSGRMRMSAPGHKRLS
jgi:hypothetical protein